MLTRSAEPTLKIWPEMCVALISPATARIVSWTWQNERVCIPSPCTSSALPVSARSTKRGITIPYWPCCLGPTVLKKRAITQSSSRSWWKPSARNSSIAFESA